MARINSAAIKSLLYQLLVIVSQVVLIVGVYFKYQKTGLDLFFLYLAMIVPIYTFSLLGAKQLLFSDFLNIKSFIFTRFIGQLIVFLFPLFFYFLYIYTDEGSSVFFIILAWKLFDVSFEMLSSYLQYNNRYSSLVYYSVLKVLLFCTIFFTSPHFFSSLLISASLLILIYFTVIESVFNNISELFKDIKKTISKMIYISLTAMLSSLLISIPRFYLGNDFELNGMLGFIGILSYSYILGQVFITGLYPVFIRKYNSEWIRNNSVKFFSMIALISSLFYLLLSMAVVLFMYLTGFYWEFYYLVPAVLLISPVAILKNSIELLSSLYEGERNVFLSLVSTLFIVVFISYFIADKWSGLGYCFVIAAGSLLRCYFSYRSVFVK